MRFYAIEYAYGSDVVNHGARADRLHAFPSRPARDAWVARGSPAIGPGERKAVLSTHKAVRRTNTPMWRRGAASDPDGVQIP